MLSFQSIWRSSIFFNPHINLYKKIGMRCLCVNTRPNLNTPDDVKKFNEIIYQPADIPDLIKYANELEKKLKLGLAESIHHKIIHTDPTQKEYYNNLLRVRKKRGPYGILSFFNDDILDLYEKHVLGVNKKNDDINEKPKP